jgi:hypothetical protein
MGKIIKRQLWPAWWRWRSAHRRIKAEGLARAVAMSKDPKRPPAPRAARKKK